MNVKEDQEKRADDEARPLWRRPMVILGAVVLFALCCLIVERALSSNASPPATASNGEASSSHEPASSGDKMDHGTQAVGPEGSKVGETGPRVSVATLSGSTFAVPAGKPTALFTADGCQSCIPKAQALNRIKSEAGDRIAVLGVDINPTDTEAVFRRWIGEVGNPGFDFAMDKDGQLTLAWGVRDTSTVVIVDAAGKIVYHSAGEADEVTFRSAFASAGLR